MRTPTGPRGRAVLGVGAHGEHAHPWHAVAAPQGEQQRRRVVVVGRLADAVVGVDAVHEQIAARAQPVQRQVLTLEVRRVVVAVAGRDALADAGRLTCSSPQRLLKTGLAGFAGTSRVRTG